MQNGPKLSIIIVNYNVEHFLEQCLYAVEKAIKTINAEVFVVDNDSADGSCAMVSKKFPWVKLIANKDNVGFSRANNQAMRIAEGEYFLLLNPDTVVEEDTFSKTVNFMDSHKDAGGLGVKMIDGKGRFLPESKRGVPTPMVAFYKIFGLSKLFPRSPKFSRYHLGHLDMNQTHEVEILSGAFMLMRKTVLDKIGLLDEDYFMYGEDIDLSYRIIKAGYKNYYYSGTTIIHYKGESTKKGSINYVLVFYRAMIIFAKKQLSTSHAKTFGLLINLAIYLRASIAILRRIAGSISQPILDFSIITTSLLSAAHYYAEHIKSNEFSYPKELYTSAIPIYGLFWVLILLVGKSYKQKLSPALFFRNIAIGSALLFLSYSFLPESMRYSRALLILGSVVAATTLPLYRHLQSKAKIFDFSFSGHKRKNCLLIADKEEQTRITSILGLISSNIQIPKIIDPAQLPLNDLIHQIENASEIYHIDEIIFSATNLSSTKIIDCILNLKTKNTDYKIAPPESLSIIGSNSIHTSGELYTLNINPIDTNKNILYKRLFDIVSSILLILSYPIIVLFLKKTSAILSNCLTVFSGKKTWISYNGSETISDFELPRLKQGIFPLLIKASGQNASVLKNEAIRYAKNYSIWKDASLLIQHLKS